MEACGPAMTEYVSSVEISKPPQRDGKSYLPLLSIRDLTKHFSSRGRWRQSHMVRAVDGVDFEIERRQTLALVGESGCGKTTVARLILGLLAPTSGSIELDGVEIAGTRGQARRAITRRLQMVFQDPAGSLNPRLTIGDSIAEPLLAHGSQSPILIRDTVQSLLERVGLEPMMARRYPHEFSGGQRQRIGIARAIAVRPELVVADEPTSALDVSIRVQILNLLGQLQSELGTSFLLVSHDLAVVRHYSERVCVMFAGRIVESGATRDVLLSPRHPYTRLLLSTAPSLDPRHKRILAQASTQSLEANASPSWPKGCAFADRCPIVEPQCRQSTPPLLPVLNEGHLSRCHRSMWPEN